jgi:hypothetical protein
LRVGLRENIMEFDKLTVGERLLVKFNKQEREGSFISVMGGTDEGKIQVKVDGDTKEYREIRYENVLSIGAAPKVEEVVKTDGETTYFIWMLRIARMVMILKAIPTVMTRNGEESTGSGLKIEAGFGLYRSADPEVTAMLKAHKDFNSTIPGKGFREATAEEAGLLAELEIKGVAKDELLDRVTKMIELMNN